MYISIPVLLVIVLIWAMNTSTQDEINDFFGSLFWLVIVVGGIALGIGAIALLVSFGSMFLSEIWLLLQAVGVMGAMVGLITFVTKYPKQAFKVFGIGALVIASFNLILYGFQNHFSIIGFIIVVALLVGITWSWVPFVKKLTKTQ